MSTESPWWKSEKYPDGNQVPVGLIQFDLGHHSAWSAAQEESGSRREAYTARKLLSETLRRAVRGYDFGLHHWAGDGGLFASVVENSEHADRAYEAMSQMYDAFARWRSESSSRQTLVCRITGTYIPDLCIDGEPGNWYSAELNRFLKYERHFGYEGAICITNELRKLLHRYAGNFNDPKCSRRVPLPDGSSLTVFYDTAHPILIQESDYSFRNWLHRHAASLDVAAPTVRLAQLPEGAFQLGDAVILNAALSASGYRLIQLTQSSPSQFRGDFFKAQEDQTRWKEVRMQLVDRNVGGTRLRVHSFSGELLDDPIVRLTWSAGDYVDANAFHTVALRGPQVATRYAPEALRVLQDGTRIPNVLSNHSIVVFGPRSDRYLLLCHRRRGDRPGSYSRNCWSLSFEEQFNPVEQEIFGRVVAQDHTIEGSIERGLREELVGESYEGTVKVSVHAFQLESAILNYGLLAVVDVPDVNFEEMLRLWSGSRDADEHDALAALPLQDRFIRDCLAHPRLPEVLLRQLKTSAGFSGLSAEDHAWHPTSLVRLALALWLAQQD